MVDKLYSMGVTYSLTEACLILYTLGVFIYNKRTYKTMRAFKWWAYFYEI